MSDQTFQDVTSLKRRLDELRSEHQDLHEAIKRLSELPLGDDLMLRRLKKRKLALKDRIVAIENLFEPDQPA